MIDINWAKSKAQELGTVAEEDAIAIFRTDPA